MDRIIKVFTDGASRGNPGPSGIGIYIVSESGDELKAISEYIGEATNNIAEYRALLRAISECRDIDADKFHFYTDSQLVKNQIKGTYRVKDGKLQSLYVKVKVGLMNFRDWDIEYIPREENRKADSLASKAIDDGYSGE